MEAADIELIKRYSGLTEGLLQWSPTMTLESLEKQAVLRAFVYFKGNKSATARSLGIAVNTLSEKLKRYDTEGQKQQELEAQRKARDEEFLRRSRGMPPNVYDDSSKPVPPPTVGINPTDFEPMPMDEHMKATPEEKSQHVQHQANKQQKRRRA